MNDLDVLNKAIDIGIDAALEAENLSTNIKHSLQLFKTFRSAADPGFLESLGVGAVTFVHVIGQNPTQLNAEQLNLIELRDYVAFAKVQTKIAAFAEYVKVNGSFDSQEDSDRVRLQLDSMIDAIFVKDEIALDGFIGGLGAAATVHEIGESLSELVESTVDFFRALPALTDDVFKGIFGIERCFAPGTLIKLWDGAQKPVELLTPADEVVTYNNIGTPVPGRVTKLFRNTTSEFIRLSFDDREDLVATPGHRFLTETGDYMEIGHMLRLGGGTARVMDISGAMSTDTGEPLALEDWRSGASLVVVDVVSPFAEAEGVKERFLEGAKGGKCL